MAQLELSFSMIERRSGQQENTRFLAIPVREHFGISEGHASVEQGVRVRAVYRVNKCPLSGFGARVRATRIRDGRTWDDLWFVVWHAREDVFGYLGIGIIREHRAAFREILGAL